MDYKIQQYTYDYTPIFDTLEILYRATRLHANDCYDDALKLINEARLNLSKFIGQENMMPDDDCYDGWCKAQDVASLLVQLQLQ